MKSGSAFIVLLLLAALGGAGTVTAAQSVIVAWDPNPETDIVGYNVYYRDSTAAQSTTISVTNATSATVTGLLEGRSYIFYVTAVNSSALESDPSDSVSYFVNSSPALAPIPDQSSQVGLPFTITPIATDPDPGQVLAFSLLPGAPAGAALDPVTGVFTWTPTPTFAWTTSVIGIQVTDNGIPPRSASISFNLMVQAPDSDGDGIPDWYQRLVGLNPLDPSDAALDADGDGVSNLSEYKDGTDPNDASSFLAIVSVQPAGNDVHVQFTAVAGRAYRLEAAYDYDQEQTPSWSTVVDNVPGTSPTVTLTDVGANLLPERFYRVIALP